ncbi:hypothetical protein N7539_001344 [Penicillium diatomitis]|uniref:TMEM205-like domain-containing protein n=1 Tax=Penicillium diatomitis TaxID=2819901 RepID=A0A9W9XGT7_9EURO|nr:uncharacterized protein N7539_001344 [Penicillium diatomitis]KAJ5492598.1 hypothetical protein N7539_001344 [Penicillium diatomitis]
MTDPRPYHVLSYGTLLGTQVFQTSQSFVGGIVAFRALPRPQFATLQTAIFPVYFSMQTALPIVVALTASRQGQALGLPGLLAPENRMNTLLPMATVAITGLINMFVLRPLTVKTMRERKHQGKLLSPLSPDLRSFSYKILAPETRDGKKSYDAPPHSKEMMALNKKFGRIHGLSSMVNMVSFIATVWYGAILSKRLE